MNIPPFTQRNRSAREIIDNEYADIFEEEITLRTGIDFEKAEELLHDPEERQHKISRYHVGCLSGNEAIIETNRRHLIEIYRSAASAALVLLGALAYAFVGSVFLVIS